METTVVTIDSIAHGGDGIARVDGRACFVPGALPGDEVSIQTTEDRQGVLRGRVAEIVAPSPHRREAPCGVFGVCGGCSWLHFAYPAQGEWKRTMVRECLTRVGNFDAEPRYVEDGALRLGYRTRATFRAGPQGWGFVEEQSHRVVPFPECPLCHPKLNAAFQKLDGIFHDAPVELTVNPEGDEVLVWTSGDPILLKGRFPRINGPKIDEALQRFTFDGIPIVNGSFSQSSLLLNRLLVREVHAALAGAETVLDLYCGNGNLTLTLPDDVAVEGFDQSKPAVSAASATGRGRYRPGNEKQMAQRIPQGAWDAIVLDPPRNGAKALMPALAKAQTGRIVYVACEPTALARDGAALLKAGWRLDDIVVLDLFPHTHHVETVATFVR